MSKIFKVSLSFLILCLLGVVMVRVNSSLFPRAHSQSTPADESRVSSPALQFDRINEKARAFKGSDEGPIRDMTDAVFSTFIGKSEVETAATDGLKERVVQSEIDYRNGKRKGVSEMDVARAVNDLAERLGAPDYARTDPHEVRQLRMTMLLTEPDFIGRAHQGNKGGQKRVGDTIDPEMSPAEAVYTMVDLVKQKLSNKDYQVTGEERAARWTEKHSAKKPKRMDDTKVLDAPRYKEMQDVARKAMQMSPGDLANTAHKTLDILGIDR